MATAPVDPAPESGTTSQSEMSSAKVQIAYDGEVLRDGSMDVRELAPALLAVGDLVQKANAELNGERAHASVSVLSDFNRGSFEIQLVLHQSLATQAAIIFGTHDAAVRSAIDIAKAIGIATASGISLIKLYKLLKGKPADKVEKLQSGDVQVKQGDTTIVVTGSVAHLYNNVGIRQEVRNVLRPLQHSGIDEFQIKENKNVIERVTREELPYFEDLPAAEEEVTNEERTGVYEILKPSFDEDLKWTLSDGATKFNADMLDKAFLKRVQARRVSFSRGFVVKARTRVKTWRTEEGLRTEYYVLEILQEIAPARQLSFPD